jgi:hypothetical protein
LGPRAPIRLCLLALALALALVGAAESVKDESSNTTSIGLCIRRQTRVRDKICLEPPYETADADRLLADPIGVSVSSNVPHWGLVVRISLSGSDGAGAEAPTEPGAVVCRLRGGDGAVVGEAFLENGAAFLDGNGRCGSHEMFMEIVDVSPEAIIARPQGLLIDIRGWEGRAP